MSKIENFIIVVTFLALWLAVYLTNEIENYLAYIFIFSLGILHGSNDIRIINKFYNRSKRSSIKTISLYVSIILLVSFLFYFLPIIGLLTFILVSGFHFGEQHFSELESKNTTVKVIFNTSYGCTIIFLLLYTNAQDSIEIIKSIAAIDVLKSYLLIALSISGFVMLLTGLYFTLSAKIISPVRELFYVLVFFIVFKTATLLWSFAIYFVFWHSLPSLLDQVMFLYGNKSKTSILRYLKSSFVYWLISVAGLFLFLEFIVDNPDLFLAVFFSFLAAITFPHVFVMHKIFED